MDGCGCCVESQGVAKKIDLCGSVCPQAYVKTWLALEELASGEVLEVLLDFQQAVEDVPKSLGAEGHEVLSVRALGENKWQLRVRKAPGA